MSPMFPEWTAMRTERFLNFGKRCFGQKRKTLRNNLAAFYPQGGLDRALELLRLPAGVRAEQIPISKLADLFAKLECR